MVDVAELGVQLATGVGPEVAGNGQVMVIQLGDTPTDGVQVCTGRFV